MVLACPKAIMALLCSSSALAVKGFCLGPSNRILSGQNHIPFSSKLSISPSKHFSALLQSDNFGGEELVMCSSRRGFSLSIVALMLYASLPSAGRAIAEERELVRYTDSSEGFTLLRPSSYTKVDKAGATVLFEEANKGINNVGVVVTPVRLMNLKDFGSPQFVAEKLIEAEKRKESTKGAEVIGVAERLGQGGQQVYEFEYKVDSTRGGMKRVFSAAFVASKKLYLVNIAHSDKSESPLDSHTRMMLEQVLHSFDTAYST